MQSKRLAGLGWVAGATVFLAGLSSHAQDWKGDVTAGLGFWEGDVTYSIGGSFWTPEGGSENLPDKISELKFPLDVTYLSVGGNLLFQDRLELHGVLMVNITDPDSPLEDSDWGVGRDDENTLSIYSESDAELDGVTADGGVRYWFSLPLGNEALALSVAPGVSLLLQSFEWEASNLDQWYPSQPWAGHDYVSGQVITYESETVMPYATLAARFQMDKLTGLLEVGVGPVYVEDEDDHVLRDILATTEMTGVGVKGSAELRYDLTDQLFVAGRVSLLSIEADGTEEDFVYGGRNRGATWEIDHEVEITQTTVGVAAGFIF